MSIAEIAPIALGVGAILLTGGAAAPLLAGLGTLGGAAAGGAAGAAAAGGGLAGLSLGTTLLGGGLAAFGAIQQGRAQKDAADFQAQIAQRNADLEIVRQQQITDSADNERRGLARNIALARGRGRTAFAASGIDLGGGGTPLAWEVELDLQQQFDSNLIANNEQSQLFDSRTRQISGRANASALKASGKNARTAGLISAGSSLLGTAGTVSSRFTQFKAQGAFG